MTVAFDVSSIGRLAKLVVEWSPEAKRCLHWPGGELFLHGTQDELMSFAASIMAAVTPTRDEEVPPEEDEQGQEVGEPEPDPAPVWEEAE